MNKLTLPLILFCSLATTVFCQQASTAAPRSESFATAFTIAMLRAQKNASFAGNIIVADLLTVLQTFESSFKILLATLCYHKPKLNNTRRLCNILNAASLAAMTQLDPYTTGFTADGWPCLTCSASQDPSSITPPVRVPGTALDNVLARGWINMCDVAADLFPWYYIQEPRKFKNTLQ